MVDQQDTEVHEFALRPVLFDNRPVQTLQQVKVKGLLMTRNMFTRRDVLKYSAVGCLAGMIESGASAQNAGSATVEIGNRLELFFDSYLIDSMDQSIRRKVHEPTPNEVVLVTDKPWEGNTCAYYTIFRDDQTYRMYYRGSHYDTKTKKAAHREVTCYAESRDGVHWEKPDLGIIEWEGSSANNIILDGIGTHCFVAFRDANPACPANAQYKGISRGRPVGKKGLYVYQSPDGIHWKLIKTEPVITAGAFDSQNLSFWDPATGQYVAYHRTFRNGVRAIQTCVSDDFVNWTAPVDLQYPGAPNQHLYTNAIRPYPRAPHIKLGFPTRYLPDQSQVEPLFMASRDGIVFHRFDDPVVPRTAPKDRMGNRSNYMANGLVTLPANDREYAVYATEAYYEGPDTRLRRFTYRVDGFVSLHADGQGEMTTKLFRLSSARCLVNYAVREGGSLRVELQDEKGTPVPGFQLAACRAMIGDEIAGQVRWKGDLKELVGKTVRLRFQLRRTDLYSLQFPADV
jgi:hypothetical protein